MESGSRGLTEAYLLNFMAIVVASSSGVTPEMITGRQGFTRDVVEIPESLESRDIQLGNKSRETAYCGMNKVIKHAKVQYTGIAIFSKEYLPKYRDQVNWHEIASSAIFSNWLSYSKYILFNFLQFGVYSIQRG